MGTSKQYKKQFTINLCYVLLGVLCCSECLFRRGHFVMAPFNLTLSTLFATISSLNISLIYITTFPLNNLLFKTNVSIWYCVYSYVTTSQIS